MAKLPLTNTNAVKLTTRASLGAQPDKTQGGTGLSSSGGSGGTVTNVAAGTGLAASPSPITTTGTISMQSPSGDLTGAWPGSTLVAVGSASTVGDATHVCQVTTDTKGRVTTKTAVAITGLLPTGGAKYARLAKNSTTNYDVGWYGPDWFNVKDYGAAGDGTTDDTAAINNAASAAALFHGTLYFPDGVYKITSAITLTLVGTACIRGNSKQSSIIKSSTNSINAIYCDLSGGSDRRLNRVEVCDLGFQTPSSIAATCAVYVDYGGTIILSSANQGGSWVHDLDIWNNSANSGGYVYGVIMRSAWNSQVFNLYGYGSSVTYGSASTPGGGDGGAGSGALVRWISGTNFRTSGIVSDFWGQMVRIEPLTSGDAFTPQGVTISDCNITEAIEGIHYYTTTSGGGPDFLAISNVQIDQGNVNNANHVGLYLEGSGGGTDVYVSNCLFLINNGVACIKLNAINSSRFSNVSCEYNANAPTYGVQLTGASNGNRFAETCSYGGLPINLGASAGLNRMRNTAGSAVTDAGSGNIIGDVIAWDKVVTLAGGTTASFNVDISACGLAAVAPCVSARPVSSIGTSLNFTCDYDYSNGSTTKTNAVIQVWATSGSLPSGAVRFAGFAGPGVYV